VWSKRHNIVSRNKIRTRTRISFTRAPVVAQDPRTWRSSFVVLLKTYFTITTYFFSADPKRRRRCCCYYYYFYYCRVRYDIGQTTCFVLRAEVYIYIIFIYIYTPSKVLLLGHIIYLWSLVVHIHIIYTVRVCQQHYWHWLREY